MQLTPVAYGTGPVLSEVDPGYTAPDVVVTEATKLTDPQGTGTTAVVAGAVTLSDPDGPAPACGDQVSVVKAISEAGSAVPSTYAVGIVQETFAVVPAPKVTVSAETAAKAAMARMRFMTA